MNYNRGLADLYRQYVRTKQTPPRWLIRAVEQPGDKIICRDYRGGNRAVDRRIWAKLGAEARGRYIDRIAAEQHVGARP